MYAVSIWSQYAVQLWQTRICGLLPPNFLFSTRSRLPDVRPRRLQKESVCLLRSLGSVGWSIVDRLSDGRGIGGTVVGLLGPAGFGT